MALILSPHALKKYYFLGGDVSCLKPLIGFYCPKWVLFQKLLPIGYTNEWACLASFSKKGEVYVLDSIFITKNVHVLTKVLLKSEFREERRDFWNSSLNQGIRREEEAQVWRRVQIHSNQHQEGHYFPISIFGLKEFCIPIWGILLASLLLYSTIEDCWRLATSSFD